MADSPRARDVTVQDVKYSPSRSASNCSWFWRTILKLPSLSISDLSRFPGARSWRAGPAEFCREAAGISGRDRAFSAMISLN
jgi:hypothetical protein